MVGNAQGDTGQGRKQMKFLSRVYRNKIDPASNAVLSQAEEVEQSLTEIDGLRGSIQKNGAFFKHQTVHKGRKSIDVVGMHMGD